MTESDLIREQLHRLVPLSGAARADWDDVVRRADVWSPKAARRRPRLRIAEKTRRYVLLAVVLGVLLGAVGTAVGLGFDFMAEQARVDEQPWAEPRDLPLGARVEVAGGGDWSFIAWRTADGLCIAYASGPVTNWARSCGGPPDLAVDASSSDYLIATLITPSETGDGQAAFVGAVTRAVARLDLVLSDGRVLSTLTEKAPAALGTDARLFYVQAPLRSTADPFIPVREYVSYRTDGRMLERYSPE